MTAHILASAKAYCALIGAVLTAELASTDLPQWVALVAAACTAVATYQVPNTPAVDEPEQYS